MVKVNTTIYVPVCCIELRYHFLTYLSALYIQLSQPVLGDTSTQQNAQSVTSWKEP